jgi:hypothetical protein
VVSSTVVSPATYLRIWTVRGSRIKSVQIGQRGPDDAVKDVGSVVLMQREMKQIDCRVSDGTGRTCRCHCQQTHGVVSQGRRNDMNDRMQAHRNTLT